MHHYRVLRVIPLSVYMFKFELSVMLYWLALIVLPVMMRRSIQVGQTWGALFNKSTCSQSIYSPRCTASRLPQSNMLATSLSSNEHQSFLPLKHNELEFPRLLCVFVCLVSWGFEWDFYTDCAVHCKPFKLNEHTV